MSIQQRIQVLANFGVKDVKSSHEELFKQHGFQRVGARVVSKPGKN